MYKKSLLQVGIHDFETNVIRYFTYQILNIRYFNNTLFLTWTEAGDTCICIQRSRVLKQFKRRKCCFSKIPPDTSGIKWVNALDAIANLFRASNQQLGIESLILRAAQLANFVQTQQYKLLNILTSLKLLIKTELVTLSIFPNTIEGHAKLVQINSKDCGMTCSVC